MAGLAETYGEGEDLPLNTVGLAAVFGFLSFAGFEGAATLGEETRNPRRNIPLAILTAVLGTGIFYVAVTYAQTVGFGTNAAGIQAFAGSTAPPGDLGQRYVGSVMATLINFGATISAFASALGTSNASARILFSMGRVKGRTIHIHRDQWHLAWDHSIPPIATLQSGETISFDLLDASCGQIVQESTVDAIRALDFSRVDQVNGPIYVEGAEPGDTLEVEFLDLQPASWGWTAVIPGFGLLADEFPEPALKIWQLEGGADGWAKFVPGIRLPLAPFCGEIGLAPVADGPHSTIPPYRHGGNMDTKHLTRGTRLYLPVEVSGALFSIGDGHAAQGDGEVCGTAIETPMRATVRLTVRKDIQVPEPQFLTAGPLAARTNTAGYYATDGIGPDLMEAARNAIRHMIDYLQRTYGLSRHEAYMLCSVAVDLKLCEVVDAPNWVVSAFLPQSIFTHPAH